MPDEKDIAQDKIVLEQKEREGKTTELEGENPKHAPQPGQKTPQEDSVDEEAINESGEKIYDDGKDENDAK